jgi:hypothetical protein
MLFIPLRKADAMQRRVYARLDESVDRANEAMDYATSAPIIKAWSDAQFEASGGKSRGNVRGQHGRIAAGLVSEINFDDDARSIEFGIDVVDDGEWEKVLKGVYTGISPGGSAKRTKGFDGVTRYTVKGLNEISLVDVPCIKSATFTLLKADGSEEELPFAEQAAAPAVDTDLLKMLAAAPTPRQLAAIVAPLSADALEKALGGHHTLGADVAGAMFSAASRREMAASGEAMPDGSFPVADQVGLEAGLAALEKATDGTAISAHLVARATALDLIDLLPPELAPAVVDAGTETPLQKGLGDVGTLASLINSLTWLASSVSYEAGVEMDGSTVPGRLCAWIADGAAILVVMAGEEASEAVASLQSAVSALPVFASPIEKAVGLGGEQITLLLKMATDLSGSREELSKALGHAASLETELLKFKAMPAPGGARLLAVSRGDDVGGGGADRPDPMAAINAMPDGIAKATALTRLTMSGAVPATRT